MRELYYRWEWRLQASPQQLWPLVADTNRFDRDTGVPAYTEEPSTQTPSLTNGRRRLAVRLYGVPLAWVEEPFEWVQPYRFGVVRRYEPGPIPMLQPLAQLRALAQLQALPEGGTHLVYEVWAQPRNWLGYLAIPAQIGLLFARRFDTTFRQYDQLALAKKSFFDLPAQTVRFAPGGRERLATLRQSLLEQGAQPALVERLVNTMTTSDDLTLYKLRPYQLADVWGAPRRAVLELCLLATRLGLLNFQWDLLCPVCRVVKESASTLEAVAAKVHCETCQIDYDVNFEQSVELTFRPNPAVRLIDEHVEFCTAGPQATPHIAVQQLLTPGTVRVVCPQLETGRYRLRTLGAPGWQIFEVVDNGPASVQIQGSQDGSLGEAVTSGPMPELEMQNHSNEERLLILERIAWTDQATTAAEVIALQQFRDLFANEVLRPGDKISVGSQAILFTDLSGSTRLYQEIGDASAFGLVMDHFDVLRATIADEEGTIVKTIGDAVMAVFRRPVAALRAVLAAQVRLAAPGAGKRPLQLKAALHCGPCIAVTLNERLDYFGTTVNVASRLEKFANAAGIVVSNAVYTDPEVQTFLDEQADKLTVEALHESIRGIEQQQFVLWRITKRE